MRQGLVLVAAAFVTQSAACVWPPCDGEECGYDPGPDGPPTLSAGPDLSLSDVVAPYPDTTHRASAGVTLLGGSNRFRLSGSVAGAVVESVSGSEVLALEPDTFEFRATELEGHLVATSDLATTAITVRALPLAAVTLVPFETGFTVRDAPTPFAVLRGATIDLVLHVEAADGTRLVDLGSTLSSPTGAVAPAERWDLFTIAGAGGTALPLTMSVASHDVALTIPVVDRIDEIAVVHGAGVVDPAEFPTVGSAYVCVEGRRNGMPVAGLAWTVTSDATYTRSGGPTSLVPDGGCAFVDAPTTQVTFSAAGLQRTFSIAH